MPSSLHSCPNHVKNPYHTPPEMMKNGERCLEGTTVYLFEGLQMLLRHTISQQMLLQCSSADGVKCLEARRSSDSEECNLVLTISEGEDLIDISTISVKPGLRFMSALKPAQNDERLQARRYGYTAWMSMFRAITAAVILPFGINGHISTGYHIWDNRI